MATNIQDVIVDHINNIYSNKHCLSVWLFTESRNTSGPSFESLSQVKIFPNRGSTGHGCYGNLKK